MRVDSTFRVMWLLNHTSARKFEIPMMKKIGIKEIFTPKIFPDDVSFRSSSVSYEEDENLSIPEDDLLTLNQINWYEDAKKSDWDLANKYFDICFFILHDASVVNIFDNFNGLVFWRAYGLDSSLTYTKLINIATNNTGYGKIKKIGDRFAFASAYDHLHNVENIKISSKTIYFPLGMSSIEVDDQWTGSRGQVLFICPNIGFNHYYKKIYDEFIANFNEFDYRIGGVQSIDFEDPNILGFVSNAQHQANMREMALMFYHAQEPNHVHYHPFEAVKAGMPLIFMANGLLDRLGGSGLPGRCQTIKEAQKKIREAQDVINRMTSKKQKLEEAENKFEEARRELERVKGEG